MENKDKKVIQTKKVVVVKKDAKPTVVKTTSTVQDEGVSRSLDEHLKTNIQTTVKRGIGWRDVITIILVILILIGAIAIVYFFLDKNGMNPFTKTTTTETTKSVVERLSTTTGAIKTIERQTTTVKSAKPVNYVPSDGPGTHNNSTTERKTTEALIHVKPTSSSRSVTVICPDGSKLSFENIKNNEAISKTSTSIDMGVFKYADTGSTICENDTLGRKTTITCENINGKVSCVCKFTAS